MIAKPAILECTRCRKIFIGWDRGRPKSGAMCMKCQAREAWEALAGAGEPKRRRGAGGERRSGRKAGKQSGARKNPGVARGTKRAPVKPKARRSR